MAYELAILVEDMYIGSYKPVPLDSPTGLWKIVSTDGHSEIYIELRLKRWHGFTTKTKWFHEDRLRLQVRDEYVNDCDFMRGDLPGMTKIRNAYNSEAEFQYLRARLKEMEKAHNSMATKYTSIVNEVQIEKHRNRSCKKDVAQLVKAFKKQALVCAYFNGQGDGKDMSRRHYDGRLLWQRYLVKEAREILDLLGELTDEGKN